MSLSSEITRLQNAKSALKTSIEAKGVTVSDSTLISDYSAYVDQIPTGGGNEDLIDIIEGDIVTLNIPNGTTKIKSKLCEYNTSLTSVTIPNTVTTIGYNVFSGCSSLISVTIPDSVTTINYGIFYGCINLKRVNSNVDGECIIPSGWTKISYQCFSSCKGLTSVTMPNGVTILDEEAFKSCINLKRVNSNVDGECIIPNNCTKFNQYAFYNCTSLTSVTIPNAVTSIGYGTFENCRSLTSVTINATTPPTLGSSAFNNTNNCPIYVPAESVDTYKSATNWSSYASRIQAIPAE